MAEQTESSPPPQRPLLITIICIFLAGALLLLLPLLPKIAAYFMDNFGIWLVACWLLSLTVSIASLIGYWRMRRWGVYLYIASYVIGLFVSLIGGLPFTLAGVLAPLLIIGIGIVYFRRMR